MRLLRLYLENYLNIYNALQRTNINIDFSKCKNRITVIRSENGAGKTSIINELHPFFSNSNVWMYDVPIIKIIDYLLDDNSVLSIVYNGWRGLNTKTKLSKCIIKRIYPDGNTIDLNPNGNMSIAKDIIFSLLDINDDYITLSSLSANSKGIGAMKPSDRKRFLSLIIGSLDPYVKMNKIITQKYSVLKSMIQNITVKLSQLGNIESIQSNIEKDSKELETLNISLKELIQKEAVLKAKLIELEKEGNPKELYDNALNRKSLLNFNLKHLPIEVLNFDESILIGLENDKIKYDTKYEYLDKRINELIVLEDSIKNELDQKVIELNSLYDKEILNDTKKKLIETEKRLEICIQYFQSINFSEYENITEQEYLMAIDLMENFNNTILSINSRYSESIILESFNNIEIIDYSSLIENYNKKISQLKDIINLQSSLKEKAKDYSNIPIDCNHHHDCPFITSIVESKELLMTKESYDALINELSEITHNLENALKLQEKQSLIKACKIEIEQLLLYMKNANKILIKFPNTRGVLNEKKLIHSIVNSSPINLNFNKYREHSNYITMITSYKKDIETYKEKIDSMVNSDKNAMKLQINIESLLKELNKNTDEKLELIKEINSIKKELEEINVKIAELRKQKEMKKQYEEISEELKNIEEQLSILLKNSIEYEDMKKKIIEISTMENNLNTVSIPQLQKNIEQYKYQILLYTQYQKEYAAYSEMFEKLEMVKESTSINGIQADIMKIQMTELVNMINQLAAMMFGARFILQEFNINQYEFNIPIYDKITNQSRPDISMMSNSQLSQLSMIISFVLLYNSSKKYNIIRLDEVDNNLDNDNRYRFFNLINTIMDILHFDQSIIISHNYELDLTNCDIIITKIENVELYNSVLNSGGNIIANFMEQK